MPMSKPEVAAKAIELIECIQMWDISKSDALEISRAMAFRIENAITWKNPLEGSGYKLASEGETTIGNVNPIKPASGANTLSNDARARIFHEPQSELS